MTKKSKLNVTIASGDPKELDLLEVNARFMPYEQFSNLVANIRKDGALTQIPFVWKEPGTDRLEVLSGNHRVQAAIEAGLTEITWLQSDDDLNKSQRTALQLSHNSIVGEDDPAVLVRLYQEIDDLELKAYSGLDDRVLELLSDPTNTSLKEPSLDFQVLTMTFLPGDGDRVFEVFDEAKQLAAKATQSWVARYEDHFRLLQALEEASSSYDIRNMAAALTYVLDVFENHRDELQDGWLDKETGNTKHKRNVPLATVLGTDYISAQDGATLAKAINKMKSTGEMGKKSIPEALGILAKHYLDG